jgi:hypothetical protein
MKRYDVTTDLETLGNGIKPVIAQIGAASFDIKTGEILDTFKINIDIESCKQVGLEVNEDTVKWWEVQSQEAKDSVFNSGDKVELTKALQKFSSWLIKVSDGKINELNMWGKGIGADNIWLESAYDAVSLKYPIHYQRDKDVRTMLDITSEKSNLSVKEIENLAEHKGIKHDGLSDAIEEAQYLSKCYNYLVNNEPLKNSEEIKDM